MSCRTLHAMLLECVCLASVAQAEWSGAIDHMVIDGAKISFGTIVEIEGEGNPAESRSRAFELASLRALRIDGRPTQENLTIYLCLSDDNKGPLRKQLAAVAKDIEVAVEAGFGHRGAPVLAVALGDLHRGRDAPVAEREERLIVGVPF